MLELEECILTMRRKIAKDMVRNILCIKIDDDEVKRDIRIGVKDILPK